MESPALTLYVRAGCHLCEDMRREVGGFQQDCGFSLNIVDIDSDPALRLRYGQLIPLLAAGEQEICHYWFDPQALLEYFRKE
jgi:hypothetical protein